MPAPRAIALALAALSCAAAAPACTDVDDAAAPGIGVGGLSIGWTIEGTTDPAKCREYGAAQMRIVVLDDAANEQAVELASCDAFGAALTLRSGLFVVEATFVDDHGDPASATLQTAKFAVEPGRPATFQLAFTREVMLIRTKVQVLSARSPGSAAASSSAGENGNPRRSR